MVCISQVEYYTEDTLKVVLMLLFFLVCSKWLYLMEEFNCSCPHYKSVLLFIMFVVISSTIQFVTY